VFFERKRMLKKEAAGWEGPAAEVCFITSIPYYLLHFCLLRIILFFVYHFICFIVFIISFMYMA
jgi:hypothetical protein